MGRWPVTLRVLRATYPARNGSSLTVLDRTRLFETEMARLGPCFRSPLGVSWNDGGAAAQKEAKGRLLFPGFRRLRGVVVTFKVTGGERGGWAVLQVSGEMDLVTSPVLRQRVHDAVADGRRSLVLDLSGVVFCDSSGVGVLIATRRLIRSCRGRLRLILPADGFAMDNGRAGVDGSGQGAHVNRVLGALGVRRLFDVYPDVASASDDVSDAEEKAGPLSA
jgi:anti-anti-sigma factor